MEFIGVLLLGAVLGVVADRLWRKVENRPKVRVQGCIFQRIGNEEGFSIVIQNMGMGDIPPFNICLFSPLVGSIFIFALRGGERVLLPKQEMEFELLMLSNGRPVAPIGLLRGAGNLPMSESEMRRFSFRLVMNNSTEVLYENREFGSSLVRSIVDVANAGSLKAVGRGAWLSRHENVFRPIGRLREHLEVRKMIREARGKQRPVVREHPDKRTMRIEK